MKRILFSSLFVASLASAAPYKLDQAHMEIGFSVKHLMISNVKGHFDKFDGGFDYDPAKKALKDVVITVDTNTINTGVKDRDDHLKGADFFDVTKFPKMTFKADKVEWSKDGKTGKMPGTLTIKDKTKPLTLDVQNNGEMDFMGTKKVAFTATGKIDRREFGLIWNKNLDKGGVAVGNDVNITIDGEANQANTTPETKADAAKPAAKK